jgi:hypothetical protein
MRSFLAMVNIMIAASVAHAQTVVQQLPCQAFQRNVDGSWSPNGIVNMTVDGALVVIGPGLTIRPGSLILGKVGGLDLGAKLEADCKS